MTRMLLVVLISLLLSTSKSYVRQQNRLALSLSKDLIQLKQSLINNNNNNNEEEMMIKLFEETCEKVCYISTLTQAFNPLTLNFLEIDSQAGSGFVWNNTGMVVTNYHVIEQSYKSKSDVQVTFLSNEKSRSSYRAKIYGVDPNRDIAVLKIDDVEGINKMKDKSIPIGSSRDLKVGQKAIAIGTPFGLDSTMTAGIISGLGRTISSGPNRGTIFNGIQTDTAINPGTSS